MREMQSRAYKYRNEQYILLKSPPASGKSRALMFIALDKMYHQNIRKTIIAVPEKSIGASFASTPLRKFGFFADWEINPEYNLCVDDGEISTESKKQIFQKFLQNSEKVLICPHATLRNAFAELKPSDFDNILVAIDEFHHASASDGSGLGNVVRRLIAKSSAHIMAMTGTYFR